jgi:prepilin-type N-terminal cleavage/methylation domain-containing protein
MMKRLRIKGGQGFTLVELALVLVIVGLLITSVLKGEALIQNAKVKKLVNQKESLSAAYYTYYDRYGMYPGDEDHATSPSGDTNNGDGNGQVAGNERYFLFEDLVLAGIINESYDGAVGSEPSNTFGGSMYILWQNRNGTQDHWATFLSIPAEVAEMIDLKYDDGVYNTGSIRASQVYTNAAAKTIYWRL